MIKKTRLKNILLSKVDQKENKNAKVCRDQDLNLGYCGHNAMS